MFFKSDNTSGAHPKICERLSQVADGFAEAYGTSQLDAKVTHRFCELFEKDVAVYFVGTGTAANSLALASVSKPGGVVFCHETAHIIQDECGAPEKLSGMRLLPVPGPFGQIDKQSLVRAMDAYPQNGVHQGRAAAVTITQATELGTLYPLETIAAIADESHRRGLVLHMDGARFANAIVKLDTTPADMTWRQGVDILSFGGTKNGCWCAEAVVFFDPRQASDFDFLRKNAAQLFSKSRFVAAQFDAYLAGGLWLELAEQANQMASLLGERLRDASIRLAWPTETNEVFAILPRDIATRSLSKGAQFYEWPTPSSLEGQVQDNEILVRLVTSFCTIEEHINSFIAFLNT